MRFIPLLIPLLCTGGCATAEDLLIWRADLAFVSRYITHGFDVGGDQPNLQPALTLQVPALGMWAQYWASLPLDRDERLYDEHDAVLGGTHALPLAGRNWQVRWLIDYFHYPNRPLAQDRAGTAITATDLRGLKLAAGVTTPALACDAYGISGTYDAYHWTPLDGDLFAPGWAHDVGVEVAGRPGHGVIATRWRESAVELLLPSMRVAATYHQGVFGVAPGWSHATVQLRQGGRWGVLSADLSLAWQRSWEPTVDAADEWWVALALGAAF